MNAHLKSGNKLLYTKLKHKVKSIKELQDLGIISPTVLRNIEIFEKFHEYQGICKECRYEVLAEAYGLKDGSSIRKIITNLSK